MNSNIYLNIGSNVGDRNTIIGRAVAALNDTYSALDYTIRVSSPVTSQPQGFESENPFVNVGVLLSVSRRQKWTPLELESLLGSVQATERVLSKLPHRNPDGSYRDRELDIDIIAVDDVCYCSATLELPHPRMAERKFVLQPMVQLMPKWKHPITGRTPAQMLADLD